MGMKLEVLVLSVSDAERAKKFYGALGWRLDADLEWGEGHRVVQMTPPGSHCSVHFGAGLTTASPGSAKSTYLAVSDIEEAVRDLAARGAAVTGPFHRDGLGKQLEGKDPEGRSYFSYASFSDPDGNTWLLQEIKTRLPGRADGETEFQSEGELASAMKRAESAHGAYEKTLGHRDAEWPAWYARYMTGEQTGRSLPH